MSPRGIKRRYHSPMSPRLPPLAAAVLLFVACSGKYDGDGGSGGEYDSKRSTTCKSWQDATCDFLADKCQAQTRADCDLLYQSLFCKDDGTMQTCIGKLSQASCPSPIDLPAECKNINDAAPVAEYCKDFARAACKFGVRCKEASDQAACEAEMAVELAATCSSGVGLAPGADACLSELTSLACGSQVPASCKGVIKVLNDSPAAEVVHPGGAQVSGALREIAAGAGG